MDNHHTFINHQKPTRHLDQDYSIHCYKDGGNCIGWKTLLTSLIEELLVLILNWHATFTNRQHCSSQIMEKYFQSRGRHDAIEKTIKRVGWISIRMTHLRTRHMKAAASSLTRRDHWKLHMRMRGSDNTGSGVYLEWDIVYAARHVGFKHGESHKSAGSI